MYQMKSHTQVLESLAAFSEIDGSYIGSEETAKCLVFEKGIAPQAITGNDVASIGFSEKEQKWFGWSHRAIAGFGVGSTVSKGDCAFVPKDWDDLIECAVRFRSDDWYEDVSGIRTSDKDGQPCVRVNWRYSDNTPSEELRGTPGYVEEYPPKTWGRGEWTAASLDDAKQMATDFAQDVS